MRISDWSSDVCSSDLPPGRAPGAGRRGARRGAGDAGASRGPGMSGFVIGDDHPALPGHFPGRPIVPGVVILDRVLDAIEAAHGPLGALRLPQVKFLRRSEEHTSALQSLMRISYAVFCLHKK